MEDLFNETYCESFGANCYNDFNCKECDYNEEVGNIEVKLKKKDIPN